jgi:hypothetical protein
MVSVFQIQMHIPIAAALAFPSSRVRRPSLAYSAQPLSDITFFGVSEQVLLYAAQNLIGGCTRQLMESVSECLRFNKYHTVGYTTL